MDSSPKETGTVEVHLCHLANGHLQDIIGLCNDRVAVFPDIVAYELRSEAVRESLLHSDDIKDGAVITHWEKLHVGPLTDPDVTPEDKERAIRSTFAWLDRTLAWLTRDGEIAVAQVFADVREGLYAFVVELHDDIAARLPNMPPEP